MGHKQLVALGRAVLLIVIAVALHVLVVSRVTVLGVTADVFLIFTVVVAISRGSASGAVFGFVAGLIAGIAFMEPLGLHSLVYLLTGYFVGMVAAHLGTVGLWAVLLIGGGASFVAQVLYGLAQYIMGPRGGFLTMLGRQVLPEMVLDAVVTMLIYLLLVKMRVIPRPRLQPGTGRAGLE